MSGDTPGDMVTVRMSREVMESMFTRDARCNRQRLDFGDANEDGFHTPVITVDSTDNPYATLLDGLRDLLSATVPPFEGDR